MPICLIIELLFKIFRKTSVRQINAKYLSVISFKALLQKHVGDQKITDVIFSEYLSIIEDYALQTISKEDTKTRLNLMHKK
jgi:hypothetical protein